MLEAIYCRSRVPTPHVNRRSDWTNLQSLKEGIITLGIVRMITPHSRTEKD